MPVTYISPESQAYIDGYKSGQADRLLGRCSEVAWFGEYSDNPYVRNYAKGYRRGVLGLEF